MWCFNIIVDYFQTGTKMDAWANKLWATFCDSSHHGNASAKEAWEEECS